MRSVLETMVPSSTVDVFCHLFSTGPSDVGSMLTPTLPLFLVLFFNDQPSVGSRFNPALRWVLADTCGLLVRDIHTLPWQFFLAIRIVC